MVDVGCAGLLVEDCFCGPLSALPQEGTLTVLEDMPVRPGGCAANVAIDLARQGVSAEVAGCVGKDSAADVLREAFAASGVGASRVVELPGHATSRTVILLVDGQDRRYLHTVGANRAFAVTHIPRGWVASLKVFYLGGLFGLAGVDPREQAELLQFCRSAGVTTVLDVVAPQNAAGMEALRTVLPWVDVFLPNEDEARDLTKLTSPHDQLHLLAAAGAGTVIITRGGAGCIAQRDGRTYSCGAYRVETRDPSGSGDAFTSGVIASLLAGRDLPGTLQYASAIGASATRALGTTDSVFSAAEACAFVAEHPLTVIESA